MWAWSTALTSMLAGVREFTVQRAETAAIQSSRISLCVGSEAVGFEVLVASPVDTVKPSRDTLLDYLFSHVHFFTFFWREGRWVV